MSPNINNTNHFKGSTSMQMSSQHRCRGKLYITIPLHEFATDYHTMPLHYHSIGLLYQANTWHQWTFQCNAITQRCTTGLYFTFAIRWIAVRSSALPLPNATQPSGTLPLWRGTLSDYATPMRCFNAPHHSGTMNCRTLPLQFHTLPLLNITMVYLAYTSYDIT